MPKRANIYDLVERAAARRGIPRLELWQDAARALVERELPAANLSDRPAPHLPAMTLGAWLVGFRAAIDRGNEPGNFAHILKLIILRVADFEKWLRKTNKGRRGPLPATTGYQAADRKVFPRISKLMKTGRARSAHDAAQQLAKEGQIAGKGDAESTAKRVAKLYLREHG